MKLNEIQLATRLDQARAWVEEEKYLHAIQAYLRLIRSEPGFLPAYVELSGLYVELNKFTAATQILFLAEPHFPGNPEITFLLGNVYMRAEEYDKALTCFKRLSSMKLPHVHFNMGVAYFCKNNIPRAEEQFRLTLKYDPRFPKVNESLGELLIRRNAFAEAISYLKKGIDADPYNAVNHQLLGIAYRHLLDWTNAYNEFVIAIEMDPNEPSNWRFCGEMLRHLKRLDEGEQYLRKALELSPASVETLVVLAQVAAAKGDTEKAREFLDHALQLDPVNADAREVRWKIYKAGDRSSRT